MKDTQAEALQAQASQDAQAKKFLLDHAASHFKDTINNVTDEHLKTLSSLIHRRLWIMFGYGVVAGTGLGYWFTSCILNP